jgi:hypothetical protein
MPSVASNVGRLQARHDVERDQQEDQFAREEQQVRAREDQKRQDLIDSAKDQARTAAPSGGRAPVRIPSDQEHANARSAAIQTLHLAHDKKRKSLRDKQAKEIEAVRKKGPTPGKHVAPREPESHHGISTIWRNLDSARQQAGRAVMEKYARLHDDADSDVLDKNKSQAAGRYAKAGTRTADDMERQHEETHRKIAKSEHDELRVLWAQYEAELESDRRRIHAQVTERGMLAKKHFEDNERARR